MKRLILLISVMALVLAACGTGQAGDAGVVTLPGSGTTLALPETTTTLPGNASTTPTTMPTAVTESTVIDQLFVELFFVKGGASAKSVIRAVETPQVATNAIRALIEGPTPAEQDTELYTSIPADTLLLGLTIENGLATIDLSREFEAGGGSLNILSRLAQVVYTLTQFPTVDEVLFHLDGQPVDVFSGEGVILDGPVDRSDYISILPIESLGPPATASLWEQEDLPDVTDVDPASLSRVALVTADDVLNVREDPTVQAPIVGMLAPGVVVERTGQEAITGSSVWVEIVTPIDNFWVNSWFLAADVSEAAFAADARVSELLEQFAAIVANNGDLRAVTSRRGLYVSHNADPVRFTPDELQSVLTDPTTYKWPSAAVGPDQPEEIPSRTFAEAITDSFLSAYDDVDVAITKNEPITGGNGRMPEYAIPFQLESFNYVGVHDSGDNPEYGGLDWVTWYVSIDYEDGAPVIVGLTIDTWVP